MRHFLLALAMLCQFTAFATTPDWKWLQVGTATSVSGNSIATDADGNSYITGNFSSYIVFGTKVVSSLKANSIYIAKYDNTGKLIWVKQADNALYGSISSNAICIDGSGNSYITGSFTSEAIFDTTKLKVYGSTQGLSDIFIAKYDKDGNFVWVKQAGGDHADQGSSITIDGNNMVTVTGTCADAMDFGNNVTTKGINHSAGCADVFMAQYNTSGACQWAKQFTSDGCMSTSGIAADKDGNLYLTGYGNGMKTDLGAPSTLNMAGGYFLAKYDNKGGFKWAKTVYAAVTNAVSVDGSGNPAITGNMRGSVDFDSKTTVKSFGGYDIFVALYDKDGNLKWVNNIGTAAGDEKSGNAVIQDGSGNVYIGGSTSPGSAFGSLSIPTETKIPDYAYVAKYNNSGTIQWLQNVTLKTNAVASNSSAVYDMALDASGNVYATGNTAPSTMFGTLGSSDYGIYIAQIGSGTPITVPAAPSNLTAVAHKKSSNGKIELGWTDNSTNETGFIIGRSTDNTNWTSIDSVASDVVTYTDSNLANNTLFYYAVSAYNSAGVSSKSNVVSATTLSAINNEPIANSQLIDFPNPSGRSFMLRLPVNENSTNIRILNALGQTVFEKKDIKETNFPIDLPGHEKGLFIIEVRINNELYQLKHVVQ